MRQGSFSQAEYAGKKKQTRRDKFLAEMEQVVPWARLVERLQPLYPKGERGRPPVGLERMLRIYFLQQWYGLADEALEDALYDSQALRGFTGIDLAVATVPDATTVMNFRHWLEEHDLTRVLAAPDCRSPFLASWQPEFLLSVAVLWSRWCPNLFGAQRYDRCREADPRRNRSPRNCSPPGGGG